MQRPPRSTLVPCTTLFRAELFYELEVHRPGLHVHGATAPGVPVVAVGFNRRVAWGLTSGQSDDDDLYAERLAGGPGLYRRLEEHTPELQLRQYIVCVLLL